MPQSAWPRFWARPAPRWLGSDRFPRMKLVVYTVVALIGLLIGFAFGLGGALCALIFLTILTMGIIHRAAEPILVFLRG